MSVSRRKTERFDKRLDVLLMIDGEAFQGQTRNLSCAGAFVEVDLNFRFIKDTAIGLHFFVPKDDTVVPVQCRGTICWVEGVLPNGTGFGIQFEELTEEEQAALRSFFDVDQKDGTDLGQKHRVLMGQALERWVEKGLVSKTGAERYRASVID